MAFGNVYIFNLYGTTATVTNLNGQGQAGSAMAPPSKTGTPPYGAQQTVVGRTNLTVGQLDSPLFVNVNGNNEPNELTINYGGQAWRAKVYIPSPPAPRLETDLWLYLAYQQAFLFDSVTGAIINQPDGKTSIKLEKAAAETPA